MNPRIRKVNAIALATALAAPAWAHHGIGRYDPAGYVELKGTLTGLDFRASWSTR